MTTPVRIQTEAGTRLEQLHASYAEAKAAADAAAETLKAVTDAIKLELTTAAPEATRIDLATPGAVPLRLAWQETWRFDSKRLKAEDPEAYVRYAKKSGAWVLRPVKDDA